MYLYIEMFRKRNGLVSDWGIGCVDINGTKNKRLLLYVWLLADQWVGMFKL